MKKVISVFLCIAMLFVLCSCANSNNSTNNSNDSSSKQEQKKSGIYWGMTFKETRSYMEEDMQMPFAQSARYVSGAKFRIFDTNNFNGLGEAELLFHQGDEDSLDAMYIDLKDTTQKENFLTFLTEKLGQYNSTESQPFMQLTSDSYQAAKELYVWDTQEFYGVLRVIMKKDTQEIDSLSFTAAINKDVYGEYWE